MKSDVAYIVPLYTMTQWPIVPHGWPIKFFVEIN